MSEYIKFQDNKKECVELAFEQPLEGTNQFGKKQYTYGIKQNITGEEKFSATEKLHEKIQALNASKGDSIYIEKVKDPEINKGFAFFKVEMKDCPVEKPKGPLHESVKKFEEQFAPEKSMDVHELSIRIEKLESITATLWKWYQGVTAEKGHQPGDESLPF